MRSRLRSNSPDLAEFNGSVRCAELLPEELPRTSYGAEGRRRSVLSADSLKANVHEEGFDRSPGQGRKRLLRAGSGKSPLDEPVWRWHYILCVAALPQLDRGSDYESERHRFESCTPHQSNFKVLLGAPFLFRSPCRDSNLAGGANASFRERRMPYRRKGAIAWLKPSHNGNKNRERESRSA